MSKLEVNIAITPKGDDNYEIAVSDKLTASQAQTITKIAIRSSSYIGKSESENINVFANILALYVIRFNTNLSNLANSPKEIFMLDTTDICKAFSLSDKSFQYEPILLSNVFKGLFI